MDRGLAPHTLSGSSCTATLKAPFQVRRFGRGGPLRVRPPARPQAADQSPAFHMPLASAAASLCRSSASSSVALSFGAPTALAAANCMSRADSVRLSACRSTVRSSITEPVDRCAIRSDRSTLAAVSWRRRHNDPRSPRGASPDRASSIACSAPISARDILRRVPCIERHRRSGIGVDRSHLKPAVKGASNPCPRTWRVKRFQNLCTRRHSQTDIRIATVVITTMKTSSAVTNRSPKTVAALAIMACLLIEGHDISDHLCS